MKTRMLCLVLLLVVWLSGCSAFLGNDSGLEPWERMSGASDPDKEDDMNGKEKQGEQLPTILIRETERYQKMEGFGTSGCWWAQDVGTWDNGTAEQIADWLFDPEKGIGLSQYRFNVGAGDLNEAPDPWRRVETFEVEPGIYDFSRDAGSVAMLRMAVERGVEEVVFFANSPPGRLLKNGRTTGDDKGKSNLIPGKENEFAKYLVDIAEHFLSEDIPVKHISPINEPQWDWKLEKGQEGCHWTPEEVVDMGLALLDELDARGSDIEASLVDSGKMWDKEYTIDLYRTLATDPAFAGRLSHFAVHAYWSSELDKKLLAAAIKDMGSPLPLWQSEWCQMEGGTDFGMDPALVLARCVHEDLTLLDCVSWQTWIAVTRYDYKDGLIHVNIETREATALKRLWALGNWSRFVKPGSVRVQVEAEGEADRLLLSAFVSENGEEMVLVVVNPYDETIVTGLPVLSSMEEGKRSEPIFFDWHAWETSEARNLDEVFVDNAEHYRFPARSVTTLVGRLE